jgi:hypothetical protein
MRVKELRDKLNALIERGFGHAHTGIAKVELFESEDPRTWPDEARLTTCYEVNNG